MNYRKLIKQTCLGAGILFGACLLVLFMEALSVMPHYELEPAVVRKVVPDARGFVGADEMTLIRFADGYDTEIGGNRGEPGDRIMAPRQRGTETMLGILASKQRLVSK